MLLFGVLSPAAVATAVLFVLCSITFSILEGLHAIDAAYLATGIMTTVGMVIVPRSAAGRVAAALFNIITLGLGAIVLAEIGEARRVASRSALRKLAVSSPSVPGGSRPTTTLGAAAVLIYRRCCGRAFDSSSDAAHSHVGVAAGAAAAMTAAGSAATGDADIIGGGPGGGSVGAPLLAEAALYAAAALPAAVAAALAFRVLEGWPLAEAFFFVLLAGSGLGMGDVEPRHPAGRLLFIVYVWGNMGATLGLLGVLGVAVQDRAEALLRAAPKGWATTIAAGGGGSGDGSTAPSAHATAFAPAAGSDVATAAAAVKDAAAKGLPSVGESARDDAASNGSGGVTGSGGGGHLLVRVVGSPSASPVASPLALALGSGSRTALSFDDAVRIRGGISNDSELERLLLPSPSASATPAAALLASAGGRAAV